MNMCMLASCGYARAVAAGTCAGAAAGSSSSLLRRPAEARPAPTCLVLNHFIADAFHEDCGHSNLTHQCNRSIDIVHKWDTTPLY